MSVLLAAISFVRLIAFFGNSTFQALLNPNVVLVILVGMVFLVGTLKTGNVGRIVQVATSYLIAYGTAFDGDGGDLTSTVFLIAAMMLASEYGLLTHRPRAIVGSSLVVYVGCFFVGTYIRTGAILASVHVLLGAGVVAFLFVAIIRTRLEQVRNREDELETKVAQRTSGLRREVKRRAELEDSLRETAVRSQRLASDRALLLHELHHRTKNDLQLIASMIRLHGEDDENSTKQDLLTAAEDRIMAIALVHEYLYSSEELSAIGLADYLDGLIAHMRSAHSGAQIAIEQEINTDLSVGIEPAIHLGLAINELVQNARKHAFPDGGRGTVTITANEIGKNLQLVVSDDGIGMGDAPKAPKRGSVGIEIVKALVAQLEGEISIQSGTRATWTMVLPIATLLPQSSKRDAGGDANQGMNPPGTVHLRSATNASPQGDDGS
ncbi:MAG: sensor histidine kinase [Spirochaetaceae bacterium]|nr:sensor histidine kinase [Spirochaetaceae bacterium]